MNRSLTNVIFGGIAPIAQSNQEEIKGQVTKTTVEETVEALANAESVIIVRAPYFVAQCSSLLMHSSRSSGTEWRSRKRNTPSPR